MLYQKSKVYYDAIILQYRKRTLSVNNLTESGQKLPQQQ